MKANTKKLLSLLMAVAMVLSMAPAISLQAEAAEFDAATTVCEACGVVPEGGWKEIATSTAGVTLSTTGHYYLSGKLDGSTKPMLQIAAGATVCLHSNGYNIRNSRSASNTTRTVAINVAGTLNYMGNGSVINRSETTTYPSVVIDGGSLKVYGGTFYNFDPSAYLAVGYGAADNGQEANKSWTVSKLTLPTECPCGATGLTAADWTALTSAGFSTGVTEHKHWFVYGALTVTGTSNSLQTGADQCVYLMSGATLTNNGTVRARGGYDVHFFGEGSYVRANSEGTGDMFDSASSGNIYFHSGTYTNNANVTMFGGSRYIITGGTFNADPSEFVKAGYAATENNGVWTVAEATEPEPTEPEPTEPEPSVPETTAPVVTEPSEPEPSEPAAFSAVCPVHGEVTTWTAVDAATGTSDWNKGSGHFYLTKDLTGSAKRVMQFIADDEVCLHLNGHSITSTCTTASSITVRSYGTLRIMGEGTIAAGSNAPMGAVVAYAGTVEVYGGTYVGAETVRENGGDIKVYGGTYPKEIVAFLQPGYVCNENTDGTWTVSKLDLECAHCNEENITWEAFAGGYIGVENDTTFHHYYLADDVSSTAAWAIQNQAGAANAVLNLNGKTLELTGGIRTRAGGELYIVGEGSVIRNESDVDVVLEANATNIYIMGGDFRNNDTDVAMFSGEKFVITGGTFNVDPSAFVAEGYVATEVDGIWTVAEGHACVWGEGVQTQAPTCTAEGVMTYTCTVEGCGKTKTESIAKLDHDFSANGPTCANCTEANPNYVSNLPTICPGCGETVTEWKPVTNGTGTNAWSQGSGHFYLANSITGGGKRLFQFDSATDEICLHLNGNDITSTSTSSGALTIRNYGTLRIMGEGTISAGENTDAAAAVGVYATGVVKIYGGTYLANNNEVAVRVMATGASITVYGGTHSKVSPAFIPEGYEAVENQDGTFTVAAKSGPALPTTCPCGAENIEWTELTSTGFGANQTTHNHYYISENTTITGTANSLQTYADQCIYLPEGLTLTNNGRLRLRGGFNVHIFGNGNYVHADGESAYGMFDSASTGYLYIHGGNFTDNETNGVAPFSGSKYSITGGTFNFDPSVYVPDGYKATEEGDIWTVAEYVAPPHPVNCPMCGAENVTWTEVDKATGDTGFAASGHYILVDDIIGTAKRVFSVPAEMEVCLYLNGWNITGTIVNNAPVALRSYGTLRVGGEGTVSTPNVTPNEDGETTWSVVAADGENAVIKIYGGTYIDGAARNHPVRTSNNATLTIYGGTFSNDVDSFTAENKWALPNGEMWTVEDLAAAAVITENGYQIFATTEEAVAAYNGGYILMGSADAIELTKDAFVNNNGKNVTVTGTGALKPVGDTDGSWDLTDANVQRDTTDPMTGERFLTVGDQTYSFKMKVTKVALRPGTTSETLGIYYKTEIIVGDELANLVDSYGVALSLVEMPTADDILAVDTHALYTVVDNDLVAGTNVKTSGLLKNILKESYTPEELAALSAQFGREVTTTAEANSLRAELKIYANAYVALDMDGDGEEEIIMADVEYNNIENTLKGIMGKVDAMAEIPQAGIDCYKAWAPLGMSDWGLTNLAAKAAE